MKEEMMTFANELKEELEKATGKGFKLNVSKGVNQENIHLVEEEKIVAASIRVNDLWGAYKRGASVEKIAQEVVEGLKSTPECPVEVEDLTKLEKVKDFVSLRCINLKKNVTFLDDKVWFATGPLALYFILTDGKSWTISVTQKLADIWGVGLKELQTLAYENMQDGWQLRDLGEIIPFMPLEEGMISYLSSKSGMFGASVLFIPGVAEKVCELLGEESIMLAPASVHEWLVFKSSLCNSVSGSALLSLVREVNSTEVKEEDFLADDVWYYTKGIGFSCESEKKIA